MVLTRLGNKKVLHRCKRARALFCGQPLSMVSTFQMFTHSIAWANQGTTNTNLFGGHFLQEDTDVQLGQSAANNVENVMKKER